MYLNRVAVIDLSGGQVVHARRGDRANYRPLRSTLCEGCDPVTVARALARLPGIHSLYIADLDAIQRRGDHTPQLEAIRAALPATPLWVDAGFECAEAVRAFARRRVGVPVVGSESLSDAGPLARLADEGIDCVLSLDFRGEEFLGPREVLDNAACWPQRVIAMNLARVGSALGPDLALVRLLHNRAPSKHVYASGGVRHPADLVACEQAGAAGVLLATSLHDGSLMESGDAP